MAKCEVMIMAKSLSKLCNRYFCPLLHKNNAFFYKKG